MRKEKRGLKSLLTRPNPRPILRLSELAFYRALKRALLTLWALKYCIFGSILNKVSQLGVYAPTQIAGHGPHI